MHTLSYTSMYSLPILLFSLLLPFLYVLFHISSHGKLTAKLPPGPWQLPIIGNLHMLGKTPHISLKNLAQVYGPIMYLRLGIVPTIVVTSPQAAELILKQHDSSLASRPSLFHASKYIWYGSKAIAFTPYGEYWRRVRKMCSLQLLSAEKVKGFEELTRREVEVVVGRLRLAAVAQEIVNVGEIVGELLEGMMFKMMVGKSKLEIKGRQEHNLKGLVEEALILAGAINFADFLPFLAPFDFQGLRRKMKHISKEVDETMESIIKDRLKEQQTVRPPQDILGCMLEMMEDTSDEFLSSFTRESVKAILLDLFGGGIETTAPTIIWALSSLLHNPRVMKLLQKELDSVIGRDRLVKESDFSKLPYLDLVIKETLRLFPVAPMLAPHFSMEEVSIGSYTVPKGTRIVVNAWAIQRDPAVWSDNADEFCPERFTNRDICVQGKNFEWIPFGSGRRVCPGMHLGVANVKLILAQLVHCFDWVLPYNMQPEDLDMTGRFGLTMPKADKLLAIPSYRLHVEC